MAKFRHISTKLVLVLDAGTENGKKVTKRVTISNIREDASADALWELAYPVAEVRLYKVEELVREAGDGEAGEKGGDQREADTGADNARTDGEKALPDFTSHDGELLEEKAALAREAGLAVQAPRSGAGYANARNRQAAAVFPGAAARMNSPPFYPADCLWCFA